MDRNYSKSFTKLMDLEGVREGANDRGGTTKHGVTQPVFDDWRAMTGGPRESVLVLEKPEAYALFYNMFWRTTGASNLPDGLDFAVFQAGVNIGDRMAVILLQRILGVTADGIVGPQTLAAVKTWPLDSLIATFLQSQKDYYDKVIARHPTQVSNFDGWMNRVDNSLAFIKAHWLGVASGTAFFSRPRPLG